MVVSLAAVIILGRDMKPDTNNILIILHGFILYFFNQ